MSLQRINFLHLTASEIQPRQTFLATRLPGHLDTMGENNNLTALKGCEVKHLSQILNPKKQKPLNQQYVHIKQNI